MAVLVRPALTTYAMVAKQTEMTRQGCQGNRPMNLAPGHYEIWEYCQSTSVRNCNLKYYTTS